MNTQNKSKIVAERHGKILLIVSIAFIFVWLLLSDGYYPKLGFFGSFYNTMSLHESKWFCRQVEFRYSSSKDDYIVAVRAALPRDTVEKCINVRLATKYFVLLSIIFATYGFLILRQLCPNPFPTLFFIIKKSKSDDNQLNGDK